MDAVHAVEQALAAAKLHLVRDIEGRGLPSAQHASSTAVWLREHLRISIHAAKRLVDLARSVDERPALDSALVTGAVNVEQVTIVAAAVRDLPADLGADRRSRSHPDRPGRRVRAERILTYVAPEIAEAADRAALERMEARARQTRAFQLTRNGDGRVRLTGWLDEDGAATVNAALDPCARPATTTSPAPPRSAGRTRWSRCASWRCAPTSSRRAADSVHTW
ncbi:hypothetical protein Prum_081140 [Phytohabitans rumicis]|uniref:DUF222 domain-containing protein n=1 Tax=Phytohabitans rumicis TaxID=1076125 RepID=A0A6V8LB88_9ACTN|nr:hypothetical protein Prum_081140 [Phytohabitans rumicis]